MCSVASKLCFIFIVVHFIASPWQFIQAQDVESIGSNLRNLKSINTNVGGGINLNSSLYSSNSIDPRRDPFTWSVMANLNLNVMGINAPFSFMFSEGYDRFNLPSYTFTGISPTYKWATLHAGDRSLYFNRYTLSNLNFRGAGLELTPGKWTIKTMYGRLRKAEAEDLNARQSLDPVYERLAWGLLASYSNQSYEVTFALFRAFDKENSISTPTNTFVTPADNMVLSLSGRKAFGSHFVVDADVARSGFNADVRAGDENNELDGIHHTFLGLFQPTNSASFGNAFNVGLTYTQPAFSVRLGTEKVDRNFQSLGALFFNNDLIHYTASFTTAFLKKKVTLGLRGGIEQTNLEDNIKPKNDRVVASVNVGYTASPQLSFNGNYSNFENTTKIRAKEDPEVFIDSLFLAQATRSAGISGSYRFKNKTNPSSINFSFSNQKAKSILNDQVIDEAVSTFNNINVGYTRRIKQLDMRVNASVNYNISEFAATTTTSIAPSFQVSKAFFDKKLRSSLRSAYSLVDTDAGAGSQVLNIGWNNSWSVLKNQRVMLQLNYIKRNSDNVAMDGFSELYGSIRYAYKFNKSITGGKKK
jgi:hypothetical protein